MTQLQTVPPPSDVDALARLPRDIAIVKIENDSMMAMAAVQARSHADILADVRNQLQTYKSLAKSAIYNKPVGKNDDGTMKHVRGLSIRAAEAVATATGCNAMRESILILDEDNVQITASFTDFARGRIIQKTAIVPKTYKARGGAIRRHSEDRFFNVTVKAAMAILRRDCILDMVPPGLKTELEIIADEEVIKFLGEGTVGKIVSEFSEIGVALPTLEDTLGKKLHNWNLEDRKKLVGIWASIRDGESTVAEHFGEPAEPTESELTDQYRKKPDPPAGGASRGTSTTIVDGVAATNATREAPRAGGQTSGPSGGDAERQAVVAEAEPTAAPSGGAATATTCGPLRTKVLQLHGDIADQGLADNALGMCGLADTVEVRGCSNEGALKEAIEALQGLKLAEAAAKGAGGKQRKLA